MTTPRRRWFKAADSILIEPWPNDVLAAVMRLQAALNTRRARDGLDGAEAGRIALDPIAAMQVAGKRRPDVARTLLRRLADITSMSVRHRGDVTLIDWPKWAEFQGVGARDPDLRPPPPVSEKEEESSSLEVSGTEGAQDRLSRARAELLRRRETLPPNVRALLESEDGDWLEAELGRLRDHSAAQAEPPRDKAKLLHWWFRKRQQELRAHERRKAQVERQAQSGLWPTAAKRMAKS